MHLHLLSARARVVVALASAAVGAAPASGCSASDAPEPPAVVPASAPITPLARGRLLAQENCSACHGETFEGSTVAGWTPNLTPDSATGLGGWSDAEVARAIRGGVGSSGAPLCGTMPRFSAGELSDAQVADIVAYLRSLPAASSPRRGPCRR